MATTVFGRSDEEFWEMTPRTLVAMIEDHNKREKQKAKIAGFCFYSYMNGKDPDEFLGGKEADKVNEAQLRKNAAVFF